MIRYNKKYPFHTSNRLNQTVEIFLIKIYKFNLLNKFNSKEKNCKILLQIFLVRILKISNLCTMSHLLNRINIIMTFSEIFKNHKNRPSKIKTHTLHHLLNKIQLFKLLNLLVKLLTLTYLDKSVWNMDRKLLGNNKPDHFNQIIAIEIF